MATSPDKDPTQVAMEALARENAELWEMVERLRNALVPSKWTIDAADKLLERRKNAE